MDEGHSKLLHGCCSSHSYHNVCCSFYCVPGGDKEDTKIKIFMKDKSFLVFAISDAPGLIFSSASLVTFLSIITARYAVEDFLDQLPRLLMRGLGLLFWAVATMMVASAAGFSIVVREGAKSVVKVVIVLAFLPVAAYALAQLPLCYKMYTMWTSGARGIFRPERILAH